MMIPTLETPRLRLRAPTLDDFDAYAAMWADERTTRFIGGAPRDRATSWAKYCAMPGGWALMGYGYWLFEDRAGGTTIGCGGLAWFDRGVPELVGYPEAGWAIAPDFWGMGYVSEAMAAVTAWADTALPGQEIRCIIDDGNLASQRVAAKLGFASIGAVHLGDDRVNLFSRAAQ